MAHKHRLGHWCLNDKGYPRFTSGPYRNRYVHRVVMALYLKRDLRRDEDVHHRDGNRLNFRITNLKVLGHAEHGWVSARQHFWMDFLDRKHKVEWDRFFADPAPTPTPTNK